ncbi:flavin reductase family protein [Caldimonas taiwanensis]|uniref:flavin reductase family protein n=1 Tax=Caldimonas taiwanensis TaxID=307483 RepID=UPI0007834CE0|nr:flavin reductase family protein [Caldimonas taiwanensis]
MSPFQPVRLEHASRLLNHGPTVLVTSAHAGRRNVMTAAWSMPVEFTPPRIAIVIDKSTYTRELIQASGHFGLCIPGAGLAELVDAVGTLSGREVDKFQRFGLRAHPGPMTGVPLLEDGCVAWLECRRLPEPHAEHTYDTWFAEVLCAAANPRIFVDGRWSIRPDNADLHTLHHLGAGVYARADHTVSIRRT